MRQDLEHAGDSVKSNDWAAVVYCEDFFRIVHGHGTLQGKRPRLDEFDLALASENGFEFPVLRNGSNAYFHKSQNVTKLSERAFLSTDLNVHMYVVIPEVASVAHTCLAGGWRPVAIETVRRGLGTRTSGEILFCQEVLDSTSVNPLLNIRAFDSHLSLFGYCQIAQLILRGLSIKTSVTATGAEIRRYRGDLAARFSTFVALGFFFSERHLKEERLGITNRDTTRFYRNTAAPIPYAMLILGDSHAYSSLSQLFSFYFESVIFCWCSRKDNYGENAERVHELAAKVDIVIEETAERFFLANFCEEA